MNEENEKNQFRSVEQRKNIQSELLEVRQYAIGLTVATERLLESLGHPVESAVVTRRERRLTRRKQSR